MDHVHVRIIRIVIFMGGIAETEIIRPLLTINRKRSNLWFKFSPQRQNKTAYDCVVITENSLLQCVTICNHQAATLIDSRCSFSCSVVVSTDISLRCQCSRLSCFLSATQQKCFASPSACSFLNRR